MGKKMGWGGGGKEMVSDMRVSMTLVVVEEVRRVKWARGKEGISGGAGSPFC